MAMWIMASEISMQCSSAPARPRPRIIRPGSCSKTLYGAVSAHMSKTELAPGVESRHGARDGATAAARAKGLTYIFYPAKLNCEDPTTEWSGKAERIECDALATLNLV